MYKLDYLAAAGHLLHPKRKRSDRAIPESSRTLIRRTWLHVVENEVSIFWYVNTGLFVRFNNDGDASDTIQTIIVSVRSSLDTFTVHIMLPSVL